MLPPLTRTSLVGVRVDTAIDAKYTSLQGFLDDKYVLSDTKKAISRDKDNVLVCATGSTIQDFDEGGTCAEQCCERMSQITCLQQCCEQSSEIICCLLPAVACLVFIGLLVYGFAAFITEQT